MQVKIFPKATLFIICFSIISVRAQNSDIPLVTDRPDITESALVVPISSLQIENGILFKKQSLTNSSIHNITLSSLLLRYGLLKDLEFRFGGSYLIRKLNINNSETSESGISDIIIGSKIQMLNGNISNFDLAVILQFHLPFGNESFRPAEVESDLLVAIGKSISEKFYLSGNIGINKSSSLSGYRYIYSASIGIDLNGGWGIFTEIYGNVSSVSQATINYDAGLAYQLLKNLQFDISIGTDSFGDYNNWFAGVGISIRIPN